MNYHYNSAEQECNAKFQRREINIASNLILGAYRLDYVGMATRQALGTVGQKIQQEIDERTPGIA